MSTNKPKKPLRMRPEIVIMLLIFVCVSHQIYFTNERSVSGELVMINDTDFVVCGDKETARTHDGIQKLFYDPDSMCYIEVIDEDYNTVFKTYFMNNNIDYSAIGHNPDLIREYKSNDTGTMEIQVGTDICQVSYTWIERPEKSLVVCASSKNIRRILLISNILCYIAVGLCFAMMLTTTYWQLRGVCNRYKQVTTEVSSKMSE